MPDGQAVERFFLAFSLFPRHFVSPMFRQREDLLFANPDNLRLLLHLRGDPTPHSPPGRAASRDRRHATLVFPSCIIIAPLSDFQRGQK